MEYLTIPEFPVLRGEKAVKALHDFINELEERRDREFTDKQTATLYEFAKALITSIQTETRSGISDVSLHGRKSQEE